MTQEALLIGAETRSEVEREERVRRDGAQSGTRRGLFSFFNLVSQTRTCPRALHIPGHHFTTLSHLVIVLHPDIDVTGLLTERTSIQPEGKRRYMWHFQEDRQELTRQC